MPTAGWHRARRDEERETAVELLTGVVQNYAWGSRTVLAELRGLPSPSAGPEAELWFGAHPKGAATLPDGTSLSEHVDADPVGVLGRPVAERFHGRLPFLLKVIAAEEPLSLQAHPSIPQAVDGFAREEADGVPLDAPHRNYVDTNHKPELLCALTPFEVLCGFRAPSRAAEVMSRFELDGLDPIVALLRQDDPAQALREALTTLLTWPTGHHAALITEVVSAAERLATAGGADTADYVMVAELGKRYPDDPGAIVSLLLNHFTLRPGDAVYLPAGNPHAYLRGAGVEVMAASDNVLRGGLTRKHVDVPELLRVLDFSVLSHPVAPGREVAPGVTEWPVDVPDFLLRRIVCDESAGPLELDVPGSHVALCVSGRITVDDGSGALDVDAGRAAFGRSGGGTVRVHGAGEAFLASVGVLD